MKTLHRRFREDFPDYPVPPLRAAYDAYGHLDWYLYRTSGMDHARLIASLIRAHATNPRLDVLEWGCGPGRMIRHLGEWLGPDVLLHGTDINRESVAWCREHFPSIRFSMNGLYPPLDFRDGAMDVIIARSIFTHLSEANHVLWRDELMRVLRPGGILLVTTQGDYLARMHLDPQERAAYESGRGASGLAHGKVRPICERPLPRAWRWWNTVPVR